MEGTGAAVMGDPWAAALWLANASVANGWTLEPGHVLLAGAIGGMVSASVGHYVARFGDDVQIEFDVK